MPETPAVTVPHLLERRAREQPGDCAIEFVGGEAWTFAELHARTIGMAAGLQALGVRQGDFVLSWQPNGPTAVLTLLALNCLGAVYVPLNVSYRGAVLEHVIRNSGARLMIAHGELIGRLRDIERGALRSLVVLGEERVTLEGLNQVGPEALLNERHPLEPPARPIAPWDPHLVIYTSGTTGPSKGVLSSYLHSFASASAFQHVTEGDRVYTALPMFHVGGVYGVLWSLIHAIPVVMDASFKTPEFWARIDAQRVTTTGLLGSMTSFLLSQPPSPGDRRHTLKKVIIAPLDASSIAFAERFNVTVFTEYNMTELSVPRFFCIRGCTKPQWSRLAQRRARMRCSRSSSRGREWTSSRSSSSRS